MDEDDYRIWLGKDYYHCNYPWDRLPLFMYIISKIRWSGEKVHETLEVVHLAIIVRAESFLAKRLFDHS
ncbi:MAG: hypothetical protein NTX42_06050 [Methanothrix sp.]|nr:hypothetical protein [Methanothrix sp.]